MNNHSAARLDRLQAILREGSPLQLSDAAQLCAVSEMTIRRDVAHSNGLLEILGGRLLLVDSSAGSVYRLDREIDASAPIKQALCQQLASHIEDGDTLYVDCGTTLVHLAAAIDRHRHAGSHPPPRHQQGLSLGGRSACRARRQLLPFP